MTDHDDASETFEIPPQLKGLFEAADAQIAALLSGGAAPVEVLHRESLTRDGRALEVLAIPSSSADSALGLFGGLSGAMASVIDTLTGGAVEGENGEDTEPPMMLELRTCMEQREPFRVFVETPRRAMRLVFVPPDGAYLRDLAWSTRELALEHVLRELVAKPRDVATLELARKLLEEPT